MKLIKWCEPPRPEWPKIHTCKNCKSELEYNKEDVKFNIYSKHTMGFNEFVIRDYWIECPVCESQETVDS